jgi:iron complex transport system permease protein
MIIEKPSAIVKKGPTRNTLIFWGLAAALLAAILLSFFLGRYPILPNELAAILLSKVLPIQHFWTDTMESVFFNIRLPRILLACLVGCCLSAAGASYQGIFRNPLAAPDILGASAGAAFGAALAILLYGSSRWITISALSSAW